MRANKLLSHSLRYLCFYGFWGFIFTKTILFPPNSVYPAFSILLVLFILSALSVQKKRKGVNSIVLLWMPYLLLTTFSFFVILKLESFSYWLVCVLLLSIASRTEICSHIPKKFIFWCGVVTMVGLGVQMLLPQVYNSYVRPIFTGGGSTILMWMERGYGYNGFTYQLANTANNLIIAEAFCLYFFEELFPKYHRKKLIYWAFFSLFVISVLLTGKRTYALMAIGIPSIVYIVERRLSSGTFFLLLFGVFLTIIGVNYFIDNASLFENSKYIHRLSETVSSSQSGDNWTSGRQELAAQAIEFFSENPLLGIGVNHFHQMSPEHTDVHNSYLQVLCEQGIVGFILFIIPLFFCLLRTISYMKRHYNDCIQINYLKISLFIQFYFIIYALTGNVVIDFSCFSMYFLAIAIFINVQIYDTYYQERLKVNGN